MKQAFDPRFPIILRAELIGPTGIDRSIRLLLDTGAKQTMISPVRLEQVGIEPLKEARMVTTASAVEAFQVALVDSLAIDVFVRHRLTVIAHRLPGVTQIDGLLGMDFLAGLHLSIRMKHGILMLEEDSDTF